MEAEKILCCSNPNDNSALWAMANNGFGGNNGWWFLLLLLLRGGAYNDGENYNSRQIAALQDTTNSNHNNDLVMQGLGNNQSAIREIATILNTSFSSVQTAICGIKSAIEQVSGAVGMSAESIKYAVSIGDTNIIQQMKDCCCQTQQNILKMGYESQLATERQTNLLGSKMDANHSADQLQQCRNHGELMARIDQLANGITQGFSATSYENAKNTQAIINNQTQGVQRILDQMCATTTQNLRDEIARKDRELMTASIVAQLKKECGC